MSHRARFCVLLVVMQSATACQTGVEHPVPAATVHITRSPRIPVPTASPSPVATTVPTRELPSRFFTEDFEVDLAYWKPMQTSGDAMPAAYLKNGFLLFTLPVQHAWAYQLFVPHEYEDVRIDARFEPRGGEPSATGVFCRYTAAGGWYEFNIARDGSYGVLWGEWVAPEIARYTPVVYDESEYIDPTQASLEIGLGCQANTLWLYINGKLIRKLDVARHHLEGGQVGVAAASFENVPVIAAFDWVRLSEP